MNCRNGKINAAIPKIYSSVLVAPDGWKSGDRPPFAAKAMVDTGAEVTCITPSFAAALNPPKSREMEVEAANGGRSRQKAYDINICISPPDPKAAAAITADKFHRLEVVEYFCGGNIDMLLGLDAIILGSLEIKGTSFTLCL